LLGRQSCWAEAHPRVCEQEQALHAAETHTTPSLAVTQAKGNNARHQRRCHNIWTKLDIEEERRITTKADMSKLGGLKLRGGAPRRSWHGSATIDLPESRRCVRHLEPSLRRPRETNLTRVLAEGWQRLL
jgi:hypothetical protein